MFCIVLTCGSEQNQTLVTAVICSIFPQPPKLFSVITTVLLGLQYFFDTHHPTASFQRLLLTFPFLPSNHIYYPECCRNTISFWVPMQLPIYGLCSSHDIPSQPSRLANGNRIALSHRLQICHQRKKRRILNDQVVNIDSQQLEANAPKHATDIPDIGQRRQMRAHATQHRELGQLQASAKLVERVTPEHGADERAIGFQHVVALLEEADEVVDPMQREARQDGVERARLKWQRRFERGNDLSTEIDQVVEGKRSVSVEERGRGVGAGQMRYPSADGRGDGARRLWIWVRLGEGTGNRARPGTKVEDVGEVSFDVLG